MYDVKLDCNNSIIQRHVEQLRYMSVIDYIYDSNKQHHPGSRIETEKKCQGKNKHEIAVSEPETN